MKISTKGRYGLAALMDLTVYGDKNFINLKSVAKRQGISIKYLEQLFISLKRDGIVESARGAQGGYRLAKEPETINVNQVLNSLEGPLALVACVAESNEEICDQFNSCVTRILWQKIVKELNLLTKDISLADIRKLYHEDDTGRM